jgi:hypothetical protein
MSRKEKEARQRAVDALVANEPVEDFLPEPAVSWTSSLSADCPVSLPVRDYARLTDYLQALVVVTQKLAEGSVPLPPRREAALRDIHNMLTTCLDRLDEAEVTTPGGSKVARSRWLRAQLATWGQS